MRNGLGVLVAAWGLAFAGCAAAPDPRPGPIRAMEPRPNPPIAVGQEGASVQERMRRNPWLARFWEELDPAQRRRVAARMRRAGTGPEAAAGRWDVMGLEERAALVFGGPRPPAAPSRPPARPDAPAAAEPAVAAAPDPGAAGPPAALP